MKSSLARGKWIEAALVPTTYVLGVSSLARGKWIEADPSGNMTAYYNGLPSQEGSGLKRKSLERYIK